MIAFISRRIPRPYVFFFFLIGFVSSALGEEIELRIDRNELLNPGSKKDLWLHIISHAKEDIRTFTFRNGSAVSIYLVDSFGRLVPSQRFCSSNRGQVVNRQPFHISPGDTSGAIERLQNFGLREGGVHYMIFAIPNPNKEGIIISKPCKLLLSGDRQVETLETISFDNLPNPVRVTFRKEFDKFLTEENIPHASFKLPF